MEAPKDLMNPEKSKRLPSEIYSAYRLLWKSDVPGAESLLLARRSAGQGKVNLWVEVALAEIGLWKYFYAETEENKKNFEKQLEKLEKLADMLCDAHDPESISNKFGSLFSSKKPENDPESKKKLMRYFDGLVIFSFWHFLSSSWCFRFEERVKGAYHFQRCWSKLSDIFETIKKIEKLGMTIDEGIKGMIDFGVGFYHLVFSLIPPSLQIITSIVGFEANREKAITELQHAIDTGCVWAPVAVLFLIGLKHFFLDEKEDALRLLGVIQNTYPQSFVTNYFSGFMERFTGNPEKAIEYYKNVLSMIPSNEKWMNWVGYQIGYCNFLMSDYQSAIPLFEKFLDRPIKEEQDKAFRPWAAYLLGFCYWVTDPSPLNNAELFNKISNLFNKSKNWIRPDESFDQVAKRKTADFIRKKKFDEFEVLFIKGEYSKEGHFFDKALGITEEMEILIEKESKGGHKHWWLVEGSAICWYLRAGCLKGQKKFEEAEEAFMKAIKFGPKITKETWIVPMCWCTLGEMAIETKKWKEASSYFDKLDKFKDYDWEKIVSVRVFGAKQTLDKYLKK